MKRSKAGTFFMAAGAMLMLAALSLLLYNQIEDWRANRAAQLALSKVVAVQSTKHPDIAVPFPGEANALAMPIVEVDGRGYIGSVAIDELELELPVLAHWNFDDLRVAPCRFHGSIVTDDLVIAAHNYQGHFAGLEKLAPGDEVSFINMNGDSIRYSVSLVETLSPGATKQMITPDDWDLTLFTCTYTGEARVAVRCTRENAYAV